MKIVHISDTHGRHKKIDFSAVNADVLVHSGDFLTEGRDSGFKQEEFDVFINWFANLPFERKILVAGNHDWYCYEQYHLQSSLSERLAEQGIDYLMDSSVVIDQVHFYGSPWQPEFLNWAFNLPAEGKELLAKWQQIPQETQVLITHSPAYGWQDKGGPHAAHLGCPLLREAIEQRPNIKLQLFGHIHESYGFCEHGGCHFYNAAYLNHDPAVLTYPPVIDLNKL